MKMTEDHRDRSRTFAPLGTRLIMLVNSTNLSTNRFCASSAARTCRVCSFV